MSDQEILKAAIEKARAKGYNDITDTPENRKQGYTEEDFERAIPFEVCTHRQQFNHVKWDNDYYDGLLDVIFSHDFAEAFFGKELVYPITSSDGEPMRLKEFKKAIEGSALKFSKKWCVPIWKYHLPIMVLEENPIQYLKQFIK